MARPGFILATLGLGCLAIYLFVSAPPPLEETPAARPTIPVERLFTVLEAENDAVRELWTKEIIDAGPLPALFLRETARSLEKNPVQLSLFLGSDFPINDANRFEGQQLERLGELRRTGQPQFFYMTDTQLHTGMFSDVAVAEACVDCHNEHEQTPKKDWRLHDVMGATTWLYPAKAVTTEEFLAALSALHLAFEEAYRGYITKVATFGNPPPLGERWPRDGYFLPAPEVFMAEAYRRTGPQTMQALAGLTSGTTDGTARP